MPARFEIYEDAAANYRFRLISSGGETLAVSEGYHTKEDCLKASLRTVVNAEPCDAATLL